MADAPAPTVVASAAAAAMAAPAADALEAARDVYKRDGPAPALPLFEAARRACAARGDALCVAIADGLIGNCHKRLGDYPAAERALQAALAAKRRLGARLEQGRTLNHLGLLEWERGNYDAALGWLEQALAIARGLGDPALEGGALNNKALVLDERGDYRASLATYREALAFQRRAGDRETESATLGNIGGVHFLMGDFREAVRWYEQALALSRELGNKPSESKDLGNLALCHIWLDRLPEALELLEQALVIARSAGLRKDEADWLKFRGGAWLQGGDFARALRSYGEALAIYDGADMKRERVEARIDLARTRLRLGETLASRRDLEQALGLADAIGHPRGAMLALAELGELARRTGDARAALALWQRALERAVQLGDLGHEAALVESRGRAAADLGRLAEARRDLEAALALARRLRLASAEARVLQALAEIARREGDATRAVTLCDQGLAAASGLGMPELEWPLHHGRGLALESLGRCDEALAAYDAAAEGIERVRARLGEDTLRSAYLGERAQVFADRACLEIELGRPGEAFASAERFRARAYLDSLGRGSRPSWQFPAGSGREREHELRRKIERLVEKLESERARPESEQRKVAVSSFDRELAEAERQYTLLLAELGSADPAWAALLSASPAPLEELQRRLGRDEAVIEYLLARGQVHAFVLRQDRLAHVSRPAPPEALAARIELLRDRMARDRDDWRDPAEALWQLLIEPALPHLDGVARLYLVPQGVLHGLPFAALAAPGPGPGTGRYLVERFELGLLPSAASLELTRRRPVSAPARHLVLAPGRARLAHAAREAHDVQARLGNAQTWFGTAASERALKVNARRYGLLHIATHGRLDAQNPLFSHLELEPGHGEDGRLHVFEILGLPLDAELVTLSACDTALGAGHFRRLPGGDDLVGLTRAFLAAGARTVVSSLWQVDDRATSALMDRFYVHLGEGSKAAALARAQRERIAAARDPSRLRPRDWAGFVLVGDGR